MRRPSSPKRRQRWPKGERLPSSGNICPTDPVDAVTERDGNRDFVRLRWGNRAVVVAEARQDLRAATRQAGGQRRIPHFRAL